MPGVARFMKYLAMFVAMVATAVGGFGWLLPTIYGLDTDLMFLMLPVAFAMVVGTIYFQIVIVARMISNDANRNNKED